MCACALVACYLCVRVGRCNLSTLCVCVNYTSAAQLLRNEETALVHNSSIKANFRFVCIHRRSVRLRRD